MVARAGRVLAVVVGVALLAACTTAEPDATGPSPGAGADQPPPAGPTVVDEVVVGLVVGPATSVPTGERAAFSGAAAAVAELDSVDRVRSAVAADAAFAGDLLRLMADDGADLVCLLGTGTASILVEAARSRPTTSFCGTDVTAVDVPGNVTLTGLDLRPVAGVAAAGLGATGRRVLVVTTSSTLPEPGELAADVTARLAPLPTPTPSPSPTGSAADGSGAPAGSPTPVPTPGPSPLPRDERVVPLAVGGEDELAEAAVRRELEAGDVGGLVVLGGRPDPALAAVAAAADVPVTGLATWLVDEQGQLASGVRVAVEVAWVDLAVAAVERALGLPGTSAVRLGPSLLRVVPGTAADEAATARATSALDLLTDRGGTTAGP